MRTINESYSHEIVINKSRFITYLAPLAETSDAKPFFKKIKELHPLATHHITVYICGKSGQYGHFDDDGEPNRTAGKPAFDVLRFNNITNIGVVIVRYFGGIKLGAGGLTRAYSSALSETLKQASLIEVVDKCLLTIKCHYAQHDGILNLLKDYRLIDKKYDETVALIYEVKLSEVDSLKELITTKVAFDINITEEII